MSKKLYQNLIYGDETSVFFDAHFMQTLDSHIEYLKTAGKPELKMIDQKFIGQYIGDFYAILQDMGYPAKYHRVTMLINGLTSPTQFVGQFMEILIPDLSVIDGILAVYNTGKSKLHNDVVGA